MQRDKRCNNNFIGRFKQSIHVCVEKLYMQPIYYSQSFDELLVLEVSGHRKCVGVAGLRKLLLFDAGNLILLHCHYFVLGKWMLATVNLWVRFA